MGRTVPTYRRTLETIIRDWGDFRRALSCEDQQAFEAVVGKARRHSSASSYSAFCDPMEGVILSIMLEQEKEIRALRRDLRKR
jgi:hypothetical protein